MNSGIAREQMPCQGRTGLLLRVVARPGVWQRPPGVETLHGYGLDVRAQSTNWSPSQPAQTCSVIAAALVQTWHILPVPSGPSGTTFEPDRVVEVGLNDVSSGGAPAGDRATVQVRSRAAARSCSAARAARFRSAGDDATAVQPDLVFKLSNVASRFEPLASTLLSSSRA